MTSAYHAQPKLQTCMNNLAHESNNASFNKSIKMLKFLNEQALKQITDRQNSVEHNNSVLNKIITFQKSPLSRENKGFPVKILMNGSWSISKHNQEHCSSNQETAETMKTSSKSSINTLHHKYIARNTSLIKNRKLLMMLNVSTKECKLCQQGSLKIIAHHLKEKYLPSKNIYNTKVMNDIIFNENTHLVSIFKDYLIYDDVSEFLRRYYKSYELQQRLPKICNYYSKAVKAYPNYVLIPERKFISKNIERKRKYISDLKKSPKHHNESKEENKIFTTQFLGELNKPGSTMEPSISQIPIDSLLTSYIKNSKPLDKINKATACNLFEQALLKDSFSFETKEEIHSDSNHQRTKSSLSKSKKGNTYKEIINNYKIKGKQATKPTANHQICNIKMLISQNIQQQKIFFKQISSPTSKIGMHKDIPILIGYPANSIKSNKQSMLSNPSIKLPIKEATKAITSRAKSAQRRPHRIEGLLKDFEKDIKTYRPVTQLKHNKPSNSRVKSNKKKLKLDVDSINKLSLKMLSKVYKASSKTPDPKRMNKIKGDFPLTTRYEAGISNFTKEKKQ